MARIVFDVKDIFTYPDGFGVVVGEDAAILLIRDEQSGYFTPTGSMPIPGDSHPMERALEKSLDKSARVAINAILTTIEHFVPDPLTDIEFPIRFTFDGVDYKLPISEKDKNRITLPDRSVLSVKAWQSDPPKPLGLQLVENPDYVLVAQKV